MPRPIRGLIAANQLDPSLDSASGIYGLGELVNFSADGVVPSRTPPMLKMLRNAGGVSERFILGKPGTTRGDPQFSGACYFTHDGHRVYIANYQIIHQYYMSTPFDTSTMVYMGNHRLPDGDADYVRPTLALSRDGRYFYWHERDLDDLIQYELTSRWDIGSATEVNRYLNWTTGELQCLEISSDGTTLLAGPDNSIRKYTLSTPYDISSSSLSAYNSPDQTFSTGSNKIYDDGGIFQFSDDGTKMWINAETSHPNTIIEYSLDSAYDLSSPTFVGAHRLKSGQLIGCIPRHFIVKDKNVIMAVDVLDGFLSWSLEDSNDLSTLIYDNEDKEMQVGGIVQPGGLFIKPDGKRAWYACDEQQDGVGIIEVVMEEAHKPSTAIHSGVIDTYMSSFSGGPNDIYFKDDGTRCYLMSQNTDKIYQFSLSDSWDIRTASLDDSSDFLYVGSQENAPQGMTFGDNGSKLYVQGHAGDDVNQYDLSTAWDLKTASFTAVSTNKVGTDTYGIDISADGTTLITIQNSDDIGYHTLSTAWDISTLSTENGDVNIGTAETTPRAGRFAADGYKLYLTGTNKDELGVFNLSTAYDISGISGAADSESTFVSGGFAPEGIHCDSDMNYIYFCNNVGGSIFRYTMKTPGTISSENVDPEELMSFDCSSQSTAPSGVRLSTDGTKMYILQFQVDLYEYDLSTAWDITTASYVQVADMDAADGSTTGFAFSHDGSYLFTIGRTNEVNRYSLSTAWDISTATADQVIKLSDLNWIDIWVSKDGHHIYILEESGDTVIGFKLDTAHDLDTVKWHGSQLQWGGRHAYDPTVQGLWMNGDGTRFALATRATGGQHNLTNSRAKFWTLETPYDLASAVRYDNLRDPHSLYNPSANSNGTTIDKDDNLYITYYTNYGASIVQWTSQDKAYDNYTDSGRDGFDNRGELVKMASKDQYVRRNGIISEQFWPANITGATWGDDGSKYYVSDVNGSIAQYEASTPRDISTLTYKKSFFSVHHTTNHSGAGVSYDDNDNYGITFSQDGLHMYNCKQGGDLVNHFILDSAWEVNTANWKDAYDTTSDGETNPRNMMMASDGTQMTVFGTGDYITSYTLDSAYHPSSATKQFESQPTNVDGNAPTWWYTSEDNHAFGYGYSGQGALIHTGHNNEEATSGKILEDRLSHQGLWDSFEWFAAGDTWAPGSYNNRSPHFAAGFTVSYDASIGVAFTGRDNNDASGAMWVANLNSTGDGWSSTITNPTTTRSAINLRIRGEYNNSDCWYLWPNATNQNLIIYPNSATYGGRIYYENFDNALSGSNYVDFYDYITGFTWKRTDGTKFYTMDNTCVLAQWDVPTAWDITSISGPTNRDNSEIHYLTEFTSPSTGSFDFSDDGQLLFVLRHNAGTANLGSYIMVFRCGAPWDITSMENTGVVISPPFDMGTDTQLHLANNISIVNNKLYVVPWDRELSSNWAPLRIFYLDLNTRPDILKA